MAEKDFFNYIKDILNELESISLSQLIQKLNRNQLYLVFVDVLKGFCECGPLSSTRINEMVEPVTQLSNKLLQNGVPVENFIFINDRHSMSSMEFNHFPPHCVEGSEEAEVVRPLQHLIEKGAEIFYKNATGGLFGKNKQGVSFYYWLLEVFKKGESTFIVVGDCTDLCIYQNAMGIRLLANEKDAMTEVIVSRSHVRTYDLTIMNARQNHTYAHEADFLEPVFLYHMLLNGLKVVDNIQD